MNLTDKLRRLRAMPTLSVLLALSAAHCLNDLLQSVITAVFTFCSFTPLLGIVACLLPNLRNRSLPA